MHTVDDVIEVDHPHPTTQNNFNVEIGQEELVSDERKVLCEHLETVIGERVALEALEPERNVQHPRQYCRGKMSKRRRRKPSDASESNGANSNARSQTLMGRVRHFHRSDGESQTSLDDHATVDSNR